MKKPRKRSKRKIAAQAIERMANSMEKAGIRSGGCTVRLAGERPQRLDQFRQQRANSTRTFASHQTTPRTSGLDYE